MRPHGEARRGAGCAVRVAVWNLNRGDPGFEGVAFAPRLSAGSPRVRSKTWRFRMGQPEVGRLRHDRHVLVELFAKRVGREWLDQIVRHSSLDGFQDASLFGLGCDHDDRDFGVLSTNLLDYL